MIKQIRIWINYLKYTHDVIKPVNFRFPKQKNIKAHQPIKIKKPGTQSIMFIFEDYPDLSLCIAGAEAR